MAEKNIFCSKATAVMTVDSVKKFPERLRDVSQRLDDLFIGGSYSIVHLDELPPHHSLLVDDVSGRVGPAFAVGV